MKRIIERRYGFGAAHVAIRGTPLRRRRTPSLRDGWAAALREEGDEIRSGARRALTRNAAPTLAAIFVSILLGAFLRERPDTSATEIIPFEEPAPLAMEEPAPEPEPIVEPEPEPEPVEVAAVTPEPPPPAVVPEPPPKPAPPPPPRRPEPEPPRRTPPPPRIDPAPAPVIARAPEPAPARPTRAAPPRPTRSAPPLAFAAAPLPSDAAQPTPTRRSPAFETARPAGARVRPALDALEAPQDHAPEPSATTRSSRVASSPAPTRRSSAPLDFAAAAPPAAPGEPRRESPTRRPVAATPPRRRDRGNPAALGVPAAPGRDPLPTGETASAPRSARPTAPAAPSSGRREEPGLRGVPLASLDACRSDRDEDALKQRVVAAAEDRGRCESAAGRFHFVETKNLNAFLMRIERAPGRRLGDRCSELLHALDCLAKSR